MKVEEDENASYHAMNNPMGPIGYPLRAWAHQAPDFTSFSRARMQFGNEVRHHHRNRPCHHYLHASWFFNI